MLALLVPAVCGAEESSVYRWAGHGESLYDLADTGWVVEKPRYAVQALFLDYKEYMTAEGLFFYEE